MKAVILAAGLGSRIWPLTDSCPKALLIVGGQTILERMLTHIQDCGIRDVIFVLGYLNEKIELFVKENFPTLNAQFVINDIYKQTNTGFSLMLAKEFVQGSSFIKFDADVVFDIKILRKLINSNYENCLCIDKNINLQEEEVKVIFGKDNQVLEVSKSIFPKSAMGESIGIEKISATTAGILFEVLETMMTENYNHKKYYESAYEKLISKNLLFHAIDITGQSWIEIDTKEDLYKAQMTFAKT